MGGRNNKLCEQKSQDPKGVRQAKKPTKRNFYKTQTPLIYVGHYSKGVDTYTLTIVWSHSIYKLMEKTLTSYVYL